MTRFARPSKKTSLEATPWHQLINAGGEHESKVVNKTAGEGINHSARKKTKVTGKKRKNPNADDTSVKLKKVKTSEHKKNSSKQQGEDRSNLRTVSTKKYQERTLKLKKGDRKITIKRKRLQASQQIYVKNKKIAIAKINTRKKETESVDRKREARKKRRAKGKACFHCRQTGHLVSECPLAQGTEIGVGHCYKCGSSEHMTKSCSNKSSDTGAPFPFAKCFICGEAGHIARSCPDNPKGLYPNGGGCKICGSVEHFRRDCPNLVQQSKGSTTLPQVQSLKNKKGHHSADAELEDDVGTSHTKTKRKGPNIVKF